MTVEPGSPRWEELKAGIVSNDDRNWRLGDAALEIAPMGEDSAHNGNFDRLRQFLAELLEERGHKVPFSTAQTYRNVAHAWPPMNRVIGTCWKSHEILKAEANRHKLKPGMTTTEASEAAGQSTTARRTVGRPKSPERVTKAAEHIIDDLADPQVAAEVKTQTVERKVTRKAEAALRAAEREHEAARLAQEKREAEAERERLKLIETARAQVPKSARTWDMLIDEVHMAWEAIAAYMRLFDDLPPIDPAFTRTLDREVGQLRQQLDWFEGRLHPNGKNPISKAVIIETTAKAS